MWLEVFDFFDQGARLGLVCLSKSTISALSFVVISSRKLSTCPSFKVDVQLYELLFATVVKGQSNEYLWVVGR